MLTYKTLLICIFAILVQISLTHSAKADLIKEKIINFIKLKDFNEADRLIITNELSSTAIQDIAHDVFDHQINNFALLNSYALASTYGNITFHVLKQLSVELESQTASLFPQYCDIYSSFIKKVLNSTEIDEELKEEAKVILKKIRPNLVIEAKSAMLVALKNEKLADLEGLANKILLVNESLFDETIFGAITESYNSMKFRRLVEIMWSLPHTSQKAAALVYIYMNLGQNFDNNLDCAVILAYYLKMVKDLPDFKSLSDYKLRNVQDTIERFPSSMRNLYFSKRICLRNVATNLLIAPVSEYNSYLHVVANVENPGNNASIWLPRLINENSFKFKNWQYKNEFLYAGIVLINNLRGILTRKVIELGRDDGVSRLKWIAKSYAGNYVTFENKAFDCEYLCSYDDFTFSYVYNSTEFNIHSPSVAILRFEFESMCHWIVESC